MPARPSAPSPVLVDTDPGVDDALALLLALRSPEWRVVAVTTVAGNVPVEVATANAARLVALGAPAPLPPVVAGAARPLVRPLVTATHVHGEDGLAGLAAGLGPPPPAAPRGDAAELLIECARRWPGELVVVALGPLTNLARAVERDPGPLRAARAVVAMAGSVAVGGNVTPAAEFNAYVDPEAAARVVAAGLPLTLIPLDVTRRVVWRPDRIRGLAGSSDPVARFAVMLAERALAGTGNGAPGVVMHDPLAVAAALDPGLVVAPCLPVAVETAGELTRGATVVDRRPGGRAGAGCRVALEVDAERVLRLYEARVCGASA